MYAKDTINLDEADNLVEVMKTDLRITNRDTKISYNKVLIKSDLQVKIIYLTEDNRINMKEATIPVVGFIDLPNISEDHNCNVKYEIKNIIKEYDIQKIILGLPKNMNNTLGERAEITTKYKRILEENTNIPVILFDERLTSVISNSILIEADISRKKRKKKVDSIAAQIILQDYLNKEKNEHE